MRGWKAEATPVDSTRGPTPLLPAQARVEHASPLPALYGTRCRVLVPASIPCINLETAHRDQSLRPGPR